MLKTRWILYGWRVASADFGFEGVFVLTKFDFGSGMKSELACGLIVGGSGSKTARSPTIGLRAQTKTLRVAAPK